MLTLKNEIKVFVPQADNDGNALNFDGEISQVIDVAGGATVYKAQGLWNDDGTTYSDPMNVVQFNATNISAELLESVRELVTVIFDRGQQLAVSVSVNGTLYILENAADFGELAGVVAPQTAVA